MPNITANHAITYTNSILIYNICATLGQRNFILIGFAVESQYKNVPPYWNYIHFNWKGGGGGGGGTFIRVLTYTLY